jgi:exopolysaccharide production protein ExoQ
MTGGARLPWTLIGSLQPLPFVLLLLGDSNLSPIGRSAANPESAAGLAFVNDPTRLLILSAAYGLSAFLLLRRFPARSLATAGLLIYVVILAYILATVAWSAYPLKVFVTWAHHAGLMLVAITAYQFCRGAPVRLFMTYAVPLNVLLMASVALVLINPAAGFDYEHGERWKGFADDANTLGMLATIEIWAAATCLFMLESRLAQAVIGSGFPMAFVALAGAWSVTSMVGAVIVLGGMMALRFWRRGSRLRRIMLALFVVWGIALGLLAILAANPDALSLEFVLSGVGRDATLTGRTELWAIAYDAIAEKPWAGWSFDSLQTVRDTVVMRYQQFHNGYLDLLVKGGIIALALLLALLARSAIVFLRLLRINPPVAVAGLTLLAVLLVSNISEASLLREGFEPWETFIIVFVLSEGLVRSAQLEREAIGRFAALKAPIDDLAPGGGRRVPPGSRRVRHQAFKDHRRTAI